MSDERPIEDGVIARASDHGKGVPTSPVPPAEPLSALANMEDEIVVEEGEPESLSGDPVSPPPVKASESLRPAQLDGSSLSLSPSLSLSRSRRMLRIPDDEVVRPSSRSTPVSIETSPLARATPHPFEASWGPPIAASRIITINPPPPEDSSPAGIIPLVLASLEALGRSEPAESEGSARAQENGSAQSHATLENVSVHDPDNPDKRLGSDESVAAETKGAKEPEPAVDEPVAAVMRDAKRPKIAVDEAPEGKDPEITGDEAPEAKGLEIPVDEDLEDGPSPAPAPDADDVPRLEPEPPPRPSEPGELVEVSPEDFVSIESPPLRSVVPRAASPAAAASPAVSKAPHPSRAPRPPPLLLVPSPASPLAPPPMNEASAAARRKVRPWWEDLFNDDFIRTMAKVTNAQIATEVSFIEESLGLAKGAMILDLACGTGRHAIEMTRRGYQVVGFDLSLAMLARAADEAQELEQKLNFVQGDMREMTFGETFDGVYAWNTSFGFFEEERNSAVIANVHRALKPGGLLLLDVANRDFVIRQSPSLAWFEGDGCVCMDEMHVDWITSRMRVKRTVMLDDGRAKEIEYSIRIYALHELGKILHEQGFRVAEVSGGVAMPGAFLGGDSPRILVVAEKR